MAVLRRAMPATAAVGWAVTERTVWWHWYGTRLRLQPCVASPLLFMGPKSPAEDLVVRETAFQLPWVQEKVPMGILACAQLSAWIYNSNLAARHPALSVTCRSVPRHKKFHSRKMLSQR